MSRLIRFHRIGGRAAETPRGAPGRAIAMALAASFAVLAMGAESFFAPIDVAFAQTPGTSGPISLGDLFKPNTTADLRDGAEEKLREAGARAFPSPRGGCAEKAKFKVIVKRSNDPLLDEALAAVRRDVLKAVLAGSPVFNRFEFSYEVASRDEVQVDYDRMPDREKPKLHTTSVPPKGTKVKPGDQITVTMVARDDANRWQTGIQRIQLIAQNPGGDVLVGAQDYPPVIRSNCEGRPEPRTMVLTYTVPSNPPPIVRLRAITEDFVNLSDFDIGEFPTGDWYGWVTWSETLLNVPTVKPSRYWGRLDFIVNYDGRGNLTGRMVGIEDFETSQPHEAVARGAPLCPGNTTNKPTHLEVPLRGQYTPGRNSISLSVDPLAAKFVIGELSYDCPFNRSHQFGRLDAAIRPELNDIMRNIALTHERDAEVTREWNPASNGIGMLNMKVTLRRARN